ncbi:ADPRM [Symbiodinium necroappetens]|uniref:ADPRM protein n=1 Tax=Symbiodinium necroappetens TaxID=1628268 RepID=A0A812JKP2_9DINO|nr:ADPRM [Symbiodinium necroappetens]
MGQVPPAFSFGIIADVQYADRDDALNFSGSRLRRYRTSKRLWEGAVQWFREEQAR